MSPHSQLNLSQSLKWLQQSLVRTELPSLIQSIKYPSQRLCQVRADITLEGRMQSHLHMTLIEIQRAAEAEPNFYFMHLCIF